jgi:hypothetical protein
MRQLCADHYDLATKSAKLDLFPKNIKPIQWILNNSNYSGNECLIWPFARTKNGYPNINLGLVTRVASRVMCEYAHGLPPNKELDAAHSCGNGMGGCMNPSHLSWKTRSENNKDKLIHGTQPRGEGSGTAVLSEDVVMGIKSDRKTMRNKDVAEKYGVSRKTVSRLVCRNQWPHINP